MIHDCPKNASRVLGGALLATLALGVLAPRAAAADEPLCREIRRMGGSLALRHHEVLAAADARATSNRNTRTFSLRPTDTGVTVRADFGLTNGLLTLFKGPLSGGGIEVGTRLRVVVDGVEKCTNYRWVQKIVEPAPLIPGIFQVAVSPQTVSLECNVTGLTSPRTVVVETYGESQISMFGLDIQADASLEGTMGTVVIRHCSPHIDLDRDGANNLNDCDDLDSSRFPANREVCDGRDNDCDAVVDDGVTTTFFQDSDGDGYGRASRAACTAPPGFISRGGDCNDTNARVNPAQVELCGDHLDNNCNGAIDDQGVDPSGYRDSDGDGFGNALDPSFRCTRPTGFVANDDDCDDLNARLGVCNTPVASNPAPITCAAPSGHEASLTCDNVTVPGQTSCVGTSCDVDVPVGFSVSFTGECYDFQTSATCEGSVADAILCVEYDPATLVASGPCAGAPESCLRMFYCREGEVCPSPTHPPLVPAPGTDLERNIYCAYVSEVPRAAAAARASKAAVSASSAPLARDLFLLGVDESDSDFDGVPAGQDNCPTVYNPSQSDQDHDGIGDRCE